LSEGIQVRYGLRILGIVVIVPFDRSRFFIEERVLVGYDSFPLRLQLFFHWISAAKEEECPEEQYQFHRVLPSSALVCPTREF